MKLAYFLVLSQLELFFSRFWRFFGIFLTFFIVPEFPENRILWGCSKVSFSSASEWTNYASQPIYDLFTDSWRSFWAINRPHRASGWDNMVCWVHWGGGGNSVKNPENMGKTVTVSPNTSCLVVFPTSRAKPTIQPRRWRWNHSTIPWNLLIF